MRNWLIAILILLACVVGIAYPQGKDSDRYNPDRYWNWRWDLYQVAKRDATRYEWEFRKKWGKMTIKEIEEMKTKDRGGAFDDYYLNRFGFEKSEK